jgi:hypothetical protein
MNVFHDGNSFLGRGALAPEVHAVFYDFLIDIFGSFQGIQVDSGQRN